MKKKISLLAALFSASSLFALNPTFEAFQGFNFDWVNGGAVVVMDYDNDGYDELFYAETASDARTLFYENTTGVMEKKTLDVVGLPTGRNSCGMAAIDYNKDGKMDMICAGHWPMNLQIYKNNGDKTFSLDETQTALRGARDYEWAKFIAVADFDGNGYDDIFVMAQMYQKGSTESAEQAGALYLNNNGTFSEVNLATPFAPVRSGCVDAKDVNGDGAPDIIYSGYSDANSTYETHLYINSGAATFTEKTGIGFTGIKKGITAFADFNNDDKMDIIELGEGNGGNVANIFLQGAEGSFTKMDATANGLHTANDLFVEMADFNLDGYMDIIMNGWHVAGESETAIYIGKGDGTFIGVAMDRSLAARGGAIGVIDVDADDKPDYFACNYSDVNGYQAAFAHNTTPVYVRKGLTTSSFGTICLPWASVALDGAIFYDVLGTKDPVQGVALVELGASDNLVAGKPYVFLATSEQIKVTYNPETEVAEEVPGNNIIGSFAGCSVPEGKYLIYNNMLYKTADATSTIGANRAYLDVDNMGEYTPSQAPGRKVVFVGIKTTPTDLETVDNAQCTMHDGKYIHNGRFVFVKDGKMYNALGF